MEMETEDDVVAEENGDISPTVTVNFVTRETQLATTTTDAEMATGNEELNCNSSNTML
jgi:hypothetical protein